MSLYISDPQPCLCGTDLQMDSYWWVAGTHCLLPETLCPVAATQLRKTQHLPLSPLSVGWGAGVSLLSSQAETLFTLWFWLGSNLESPWQADHSTLPCRSPTQWGVITTSIVSAPVTHLVSGKEHGGSPRLSSPTVSSLRGCSKH